MNRKKFDGALERQFLAAMVYSQPFLAGAAAILSAETQMLWPQFYAHRVSLWCLHHWRKYQKAPEGGINAVYRSWAAATHSPEVEIEAVGDFLAILEEAHESQNGQMVANPQHLLDEFAGWLTTRKMSMLQDTLKMAMEDGRQEEGLAAIDEFRTIRATSSGYTPLCKRDAIEEANAELADNLFSVPDGCGNFFDGILTRDALVSFQGPKKRGKTQWLLEMAVRALKARRRVALFQCGDLSKSQIDTRFNMRIAGLPLYESDLAGVKWPTAIKVTAGAGGDWKTGSVEIPRNDLFPKATVRTAGTDFIYDAHVKFCRVNGLPVDKPESYLRFSIHPTGSINVAGINSMLERWKHEDDFTPDLIICDYADILGPENTGNKDFRHQVNETWMALRRLSQEWHALVLTATQSSMEGHKAWVQEETHFVEDNRKHAHMTACIGINMTMAEKDMGVQRLNIVIRREGDYNPNRCLWVGGCFALAQALVVADYPYGRRASGKDDKLV